MTEKAFPEEDAPLFDEVMDDYRNAQLSPDDRYDNRLPKSQRLPRLIPKPEWQFEGACYGQNLKDIFFEPGPRELAAERKQREAKAKAICGGCAVRGACLDYAIANKEKGNIWGGLNENERRKLSGQPPLRKQKSA